MSRHLDHPFATFDFELTPRDCFAVPLVRSARNSTYFFPSPHRLDVKFHDNHPPSVSLNAPHFMSAPPPELESPPRSVLSRTPPLVYAEVFAVSESNYTSAEFTFQSIDRFLFALLCICVNSFLFQFDLRVVPLTSIDNSLIVGTTVIPLNCRWFHPCLQFQVFLLELQCATDGSPIVLRMPTTNCLNKSSPHIFANTHAWTDLHNCVHVYLN